MLILRLLLVLGACYVSAALAIYLMTGNRNMLRHLSQGLLLLLLVAATLAIGTLLARFVGPLL